MALAHPVVVVPGITATYLRDEYPLPPDLIWTVLTKDYERAALHPDNLRYEAREPARIAAGQLYEIAYRDLIEELRYNLREVEDQPVPVFPFGYDWRQPLELIEHQLADFVAEVIERTKLLKHYHDAGYGDVPKVNLVGHSMGGLIIAGYLERSAGAAPVAKVATLATPFQGSFEPVIKVTTGTANLGTDPPSSREREAARLTPALYYLMPSFDRGLTIDGEPADAVALFGPELWQPSIRDTIAEYIRLRGLNPDERQEQAGRLFAGLLAAGRAHRQRIENFKLDQAGLTAADWLCVVGVDAVTRVRLQVERIDGTPNFRFHGEDRVNAWGNEAVDARRQTGDGTVPLEGAVATFLDLANLVCVTPGDYGYWELRDKALTEAAGFHGILPNMNMLHRLIVRHFTGRPDRHGNTWGRRAPGVAKWDPPLPGLRERP